MILCPWCIGVDVCACVVSRRIPGCLDVDLSVSYSQYPALDRIIQLVVIPDLFGLVAKFKNFP